MPGLPDPMFHAHATHAEVQCWSCKHVARVLPGDVPPGMSVWEFQRRAICSECGAGFPWVTVVPRLPSRWGWLRAFRPSRLLHDPVTALRW